MKRFCHVAFFLLTLRPFVWAEQPSPQSLVRKSIENYERTWRLAMQWGYTQTDITAAEGKTDVAVSEIIPLEGTPYERLTGKDGKPLPAEELRKEERKFQSELRKRRDESPEQRSERIRKYEKQREFVAEIPEAYDFRLVGDEIVAGRSAWVIDMTPRAGFVPAAAHADLLKHMDGRLWIDKQDLQWARAEAHVIDPISFGLILARIGPGAHINVDMSRIAAGLWMPVALTINGTAKLLLVHNKNLDERLTFTDYHLGPLNQAGTRVAQSFGGR